jgi:hypothetical protein
MTGGLYRLGCFALAIGAYHILLRPRLRFWGATPDEVESILPGDEMCAFPVLSTHAITIRAPRGVVWPWLVQIGEGRGGFYSYDWVERLMFGGRYLEGHSATRIHPEFQDVHLGDRIRLAEPEFSGLPISVLEPPHHFALGDGWHFILREMPVGTTRLVVRQRGDGWFKGLTHIPPVRAVGALVDYVFGDPLHFAMERGMLKGIASRAERAQALS